MGFLSSGLLAVAVLFMGLGSRWQPELAGVAFLQLASVLALCLLLAGLFLAELCMVAGALVLFGITVFPSFSTIMVLIGRRIGSNFELVGTSTLLYLSKCLSVALFATVDYNFQAAAGKQRVMCISMLVVVCLSTAGLVFALLSLSHRKTAFVEG